MRTTLKNIDHFNNFQTELRETNLISNELLKNGSVSEDRIPFVKNGLRSNHLQLAISSYTKGLDPNAMKTDLEKSIKYMEESWSGNWHFKDKSGKSYPFYAFSFYMEFIWTLSLAVLLKLDDSYLRTLNNLILEDSVQDTTINFILNNCISERNSKVDEDFGKHDFIPKKFKSLRETLESKNEEKIVNSLDDYLESWYVNMRGTGWYGSHNKSKSYFFGYWSFETATIAVIKGINYNLLKSSKYLPLELIKHYRG